jgi:hypothetical protein
MGFGLDYAGHMKKTNFDLYLEEQLMDSDFVRRFRLAGDAWEEAVRKQGG